MKSILSKKTLPLIALAISVFSIGVSAIFVRWANAPGSITAFYRMAIATALMAFPFYKNITSPVKITKQGSIYAIVGGFLFAGDIFFWATGVMASGAINPTLLANTAPLWVALVAFFFFKEQLQFKFWIGLILTVAGSITILGIDVMQSLTLGFGTLMGLIASIFYAGYFLITQKGRETLDSLSYFWLSAVSSSVTLFIMCMILRYPLVGYPASTYIYCTLLAVISQVIGYLAMNYALGHLPASAVSPTMIGQPLVTALLSVPLLGEHISLWQITGSTLILLGIYLVHSSRRILH